QSGNPRGRPRHRRSLRADFANELDGLMKVQEGSTQIQISKQQALVKKITSMALEGDLRAVNVVFGAIASDEPDEYESEEIALIKQEIVNDYVENHASELNPTTETPSKEEHHEK